MHYACHWCGLYTILCAMTENVSLANQFLIAMPALADPNFFHSVTFIFEHNDNGALGIIINRPLDITLADVLQHMSMDAVHPDVTTMPVFFGGPVQQERGFVIHQPIGTWDSSLKITDNTAVTTSQDVLEAMAKGTGPAKIFVALGYAGWGPGQLERELAENAWLSGPADPSILFETAVEKRWEAAAALLKIDVKLLTAEAGHA